MLLGYPAGFIKNKNYNYFFNKHYHFASKSVTIVVCLLFNFRSVLMGISLKQAFIFVPQDKNWLPKILIGGLLLFFPAFAFIFPGIYRMLFNPVNYYWITLFALLTLTCLLAVSGYFFKVVHNRIVHERGKLPSWKFFTYFIHIGLKSYI